MKKFKYVGSFDCKQGEMLVYKNNKEVITLREMKKTKEKALCKHRRWVKWFSQSVLPVYLEQPDGTIKLACSNTLVFVGCLDCGKVTIKDYGE